MRSVIIARPLDLMARSMLCVRPHTTDCPAGSPILYETHLCSRAIQTTRIAAICPAEVVRAVAPCGRCKIVVIVVVSIRERVAECSAYRERRVATLR